MTVNVIVGCGDIGRRVAKLLITENVDRASIIACNASHSGSDASANLGLDTYLIDLDQDVELPANLVDSQLYYFVPPQRDGLYDSRSANFIEAMVGSEQYPRRVVLISTTGVYGDSKGSWVTEESPVNPGSERAKRRLDAEQRWTAVCKKNGIELIILRVPGIYANSRIPMERIKQRVPVVNPQECGYSNRIHADDLAAMAIAAMQSERNNALGAEIYNACDGRPSSISDYLQEAAMVADLPALPEISMREAQQQLSPRMLSYLAESRKISNEKILQQLKVTLLYPDFRVGLRH